MYFPYLRGKQFELLALRELQELLTEQREKISPIIEPVKDSSTLKTAVRDLRAGGVNFNIIINPKKGDLINRSANLFSALAPELDGYNNFQLSIILDGGENHTELIEAIRASHVVASGISLIHNSIDPNIQGVLDSYGEVFPVVNNIIHFNKTSRRYHRNFNANTIVGLDDFFQAQIKNADYVNVNDSQFSEEHLFFRDEGFKGFSDFLTIGDNYTESGMLPYAVAIHLSYADATRKIRIRHFVSDTNDDRTDTAGKFSEALGKLIIWCDQNHLNSLAIDEFRSLQESGHFPGLGSIKKLSIMHHIELVLSLI